MSGRLSSYSDVIRDPVPDEPRLAYADGTDAEHAELIRVQVAITRSRRQGEARSTRSDLHVRQDILLGQLKSRLIKPVMDLGWIEAAGVMRGFVEYVRAPARAFLDHASKLFAIAPVLHVDLTQLEDLGAELFATPDIGRIHSLGLQRIGLGDEGAEQLAHSPHVRNLRYLDISGNQITQVGLEAICASTTLGELRYVDFARNLANDPTPQITESNDLGDAVRLDSPPKAAVLQKQFGKKRWLDAEEIFAFYPPERGIF